jgi:hypothetical protein
MKEYKLMEDLPNDADNTRARLSSIATSIEHANQGSVRIPAFWTKIIGSILIAGFAFMCSRFLDSTAQQQRQEDAIVQLQKEVALMQAEEITNTEWRIHSMDGAVQLAKQLEQMQRSLDADYAVLVQHERKTQHGPQRPPSSVP